MGRLFSRKTACLINIFHGGYTERKNCEFHNRNSASKKFLLIMIIRRVGYMAQENTSDNSDN